MIEVEKLEKKPASTFERGIALASVAAAGAAVVVVKTVNPSTSTMFPVCPLQSMTGINCPGCGATRGMHSLLNGDVVTALDYNVLLVLFVPLMIYGVVSLLSLGLRGRGLPLPTGWLSRIGGGVMILLLTFGVLRNLPFYPFTVLAP